MMNNVTAFGRAISTMKIHCFERKLCVSSSPLVPVPLPSRMETHLWYILPDEVKSESLLNHYLELLQPHEKENVFRMRGDQLKKSAILTRALVRTTIARYQINSQVSPRSLKFRKNSYGKPEVDWQLDDDGWIPSPLYFNISHTSSLIACGVTVDSPIGIDVEEKLRTLKSNILSFARRYFSHHEVEFLTSISEAEVQRQEFIKLWTLKEAYVKALGRGIATAPLRTFTIRYKVPAAGDPSSKEFKIEVESSDDPTNLTTNWEFAFLELARSHYAAICTQKDDAREGNGERKLTVWKTIPFVEDELITGTDALILRG